MLDQVSSFLPSSALLPHLFLAGEVRLQRRRASALAARASARIYP
jgi:hypothetical protein